MPDIVQLCGILFSDVVGSSESKDDRLIAEAQGHLQEFAEKQVPPEKCVFKNTWGDGLVLVCSDPSDCLEYALRLRDWYKNRNWRKLGFPNTLLVRTGLHAEKLNIRKEGERITTISGKHVVLTARIEPIVPPGYIYCTEIFYLHVKDEAADFVSFKDLGPKQLAKSFGSMKLFQVMRKDEIGPIGERKESQPFGVSIPRIRKDFTDSEKDTFLETGFKYICDYFLRASKTLEETDKDLEVKTKVVSTTKLTSDVFVKGTNKAKCQIWLSKDVYSRGIHYSQNIQTRDNSYNESLNVYSDGYSLSFQATGMLTFSSSKELNYQQAAELYWQSFMKQLQ